MDALQNKISKSTDSLYRQGWNFQGLLQLTRSLERYKIRYTLVGDAAMTVHGCRPTTQVVDILMMPEGFDRFYSAMIGSRITPIEAEGQRLFWDSRTGLTLNILLSVPTTPEEPGWPMPWEISTREKGIFVASMPAMLEYYLGQNLDDHRLQEIATAIYIKNLSRDFGLNLGMLARERYCAIWDLLPFRPISQVKLRRSPWYSHRLAAIAS
jgi:hypothetical protein